MSCLMLLYHVFGYIGPGPSSPGPLGPGPLGPGPRGPGAAKTNTAAKKTYAAAKNPMTAAILSQTDGIIGLTGPWAPTFPPGPPPPRMNQYTPPFPPWASSSPQAPPTTLGPGSMVPGPRCRKKTTLRLAAVPSAKGMLRSQSFSDVLRKVIAGVFKQCVQVMV